MDIQVYQATKQKIERFQKLANRLDAIDSLLSRLHEEKFYAGFLDAWGQNCWPHGFSRAEATDLICNAVKAEMDAERRRTKQEMESL